ncbi:DUF1056 family protein [Streptococcus sciuri]|uniref:DUF1056 family protein n=1 Tax=Streptococcus sciuri TaxID=2973939 RepID=A0ABT2F7J1_9STRE|nr:DUF1056 family protein [Streptococcus sciuri]MCS4488394.1 DUF1056 family protein [Streptococcus sciuri]
MLLKQFLRGLWANFDIVMFLMAAITFNVTMYYVGRIAFGITLSVTFVLVGLVSELIAGQKGD